MRATDSKRQVKTLLGGRLAAAFASLAMLCLCSAAAFGQCTLTGTVSTWNDGNSDWDTASNWTPTGVPNSSTNSVCITNGTSTVTLDINPSVDSLQLAHGNTLSFDGNTQLSVYGSQIINGGSILVNGGGGTNTYMFIDGTTTLSGAGTLTLLNTVSGGGVTDLYANNGVATLTNESTIQGEGNIGASGSALTLINSSGGIIDANSTAGPLSTALYIPAAGGITNQGLMEATNSGVLQLENTTVNNAGGNITATGSAAQVQFYSGTDIEGGTLNTTSGGTLGAFGSGVTLDGSTEGTLTVSTGSTYTGEENSQTTVLGTINNKGSILLNGGGGTNTYMFLGGNTTLSGAGTLTLTNTVSGGGATDLYANAASTLTNQSTIQGEGTIGNGGTTFTLNNTSTGKINANSAGGGLLTTLLVSPSGGITNTGLIEATNSGVLQLQNTTINNNGGNITATGSAAQVQLYSGTDIQGGTLNNSTGGTLGSFSTGVTLDGSTASGAITLSTGSTYTGEPNSQTTILGTVNNKGNILINGGGGFNTYLFLGGNTTLQGTAGSTVSLSNTAAGNGVTELYSTVGAVTLTNVNNVIQGEGNLGVGTAMTLVNDVGGTINANSTGNTLTTTLQVNPAGSGGSPGVVNQGLMEATHSGVLLIYNTTVNNLGGNITANGATAAVQLQSATIQGGTLNTLNGGTFENISTGTELDGSTQGAITLNGTFTGIGNSQTALIGTLNNNGNVQINGGGGLNTYLFIDANTTLQGTAGSTITLSNTAAGNGVTDLYSDNGALTLTNVNNVIQGEGDIGDGTSMAVVNEAGGVINANSTAGPLTTTLEFNPAVTATNQGLMEATNSGQLLIYNTTVNNSGGNITANGAAAAVEVQSATIQGGTLNTLNGGTFENISTGTELDGSTEGAITLNGTFTGVGSSQTVLIGTFDNNGNIQFNGGGGTNTYGFINANTTLQGSGHGTLILNNTVSGGGDTYLYANAGAVTLTNVNNTIEGAGIIGDGTALTIVNDTAGTILANLPGQTLLLSSAAPLTNDGTLEVTSGGVGTGTTELEVTSAFTNFSGNTLTGGKYIVNGLNAPAVLQINALGTTGGEIVNNAASIVLNGPNTSIVDADGINALNNGTVGLDENSTATSSFTVEGGDTFTTVGGFTNNGTLVVGSGSVLDINGNLTNISGHTITGGTYDLTGVLKASNATGITTNSANITLTGTGALENQAGANALVGLATNSSGHTFTLSGGAVFTDAGAFTNNGTLTVTGTGSKFNSVANYANAGTTKIQTGGTFDQTASGTLSGAGTFTNGATLEATGGAVLDLQDSVANTGGTILATGAGSEVLLDGTTISGGTLKSATGGVLIGENSATLNGSTSAVTIATGSTLEINNGQTLDAKGTLANNGMLTLNASSATTELLLTANTTISGTGTVKLSANADNLIGGSTSSVVLTNSETIEGGGSIGSVATPIGLLNTHTITANTTTPLIINASTSGFDNTGTLSVSTGDTMEINGTFTNFSAGTLTGGTYTVDGTLDLPSGDNVTTNAATITLSGAAAEIKNPAGAGNNALDALATNAATGLLTLTASQHLSDSATAFTNIGALTIKTGGELNLTAATATYTQTAGTTTVDGNLTAKGGITFNGGSVFGNNGTLNASATGTVTNNATFNIGDAVMTAGKESITGMYSQTSTGALDIDIGGTTAGTQYDQLNITAAASLNGTLNLDLINGFIPTTSDTFDILNASSLGSTMFSTVNGLLFNSGTEEFVVVYNSNNVTLDVQNVSPDGGVRLNISKTGLIAENSPPLNGTPEPGSLLLLGTGLASLAGYWRRRKA